MTGSILKRADVSGRSPMWGLGAGVGWLVCAALVACSTPSGQHEANGETVNNAVNNDVEAHDDAINNDGGEEREPVALRVATYNVSFHRGRAGQLIEDLQDPAHAQAVQVATILQKVRPDVIVLNEFDYDAQGEALGLFVENFLASAQGEGLEPLSYPHRYAAPSNTGVPSGQDLDNNGEVVLTEGARDYGGDCFGFGLYPGQFAFAVLSRYPIDEASVRTFQNFLWRAMPDATLPADFYGEAAQEVLRLSSKNHVDLPIDVEGETLHFLLSHPTPPVFDGPEDRNGRRNHDEIRLWADYLTPQKASYLVDDQGRAGGLPEGEHFILAGDQNADPFDGDSREGAIQQLLEHPRVQATPAPVGDGGAQAQAEEGVNATHEGPVAQDTADFNNGNTGNLRLDYVLPSRTMELRDAQIFWPAPGSPDAALIEASDHRLVWIDVAF